MQRAVQVGLNKDLPVGDGPGLSGGHCHHRVLKRGKLEVRVREVGTAVLRALRVEEATGAQVAPELE